MDYCKLINDIASEHNTFGTIIAVPNTIGYFLRQDLSIFYEFDKKTNVGILKNKNCMVAVLASEPEGQITVYSPNKESKTIKIDDKGSEEI